MDTKSRADWAEEYLWLESWTQRQLLNLLCGRSGDPVAESTEQATEWELERARMQVHVRSAIRAGRLPVLPSIGEPKLLKCIEALDSAMAAEMERAVVADRFYGSEFHVAVEEAIRWAVQIPQRFPRFPFTIHDVPSSGVDDSDPGVPREDIEKQVGTRERSTLLTLVAALAKKGGIDVSKPSTAGEAIEALTTALGARVSARTIEDHLKRIPDALERRGKID